jgi:zinc transport system substrate-binding protein
MPYLVFHDAYQYFERHFGLNPVGAVTLGPERQIGARRLSRLRDHMAKTGARCAFREPQFPPSLIETVVEGTGIRIGVLDPLGAGIPPGPDHWFTLMENLANSLVRCLRAAN